MVELNGDTPQPNGTTAAPSPQTQPTAQPGASAATQPQTSQSTSASNTNTTAANATANPLVPLTSLQDSGLSKRPRDARLIHMLLSSLGCTAYQERVPLQLLDFAYRHSSSILSDALHLSSDAYVSQQTRARDAPPGGGLKDADGQVSLQAVQLAISSRLQYQFSGGGSGGGLSKEWMLEQAVQRNRVALPRVLQNEWGVRLPSERFVLTGVPWGLKGEWVEDQEEDEAAADAGQGEGMDGILNYGQQDGEGGVEDEEGGTMEDLFGGQADEEMKED